MGLGAGSRCGAGGELVLAALSAWLGERRKNMQVRASRELAPLLRAEGWYAACFDGVVVRCHSMCILHGIPPRGVMLHVGALHPPAAMC